MKRTKRHIQILSLLTALLLTACYDFDRYENVAAGEQPVSHESGADSSYINLHIVNNATTTRATAAEENAIYDGILAIFEGNGESAATLKSAVVIDQLINNPGNSSSITVTQRLAGTHNYNGNKLYALVLLNTTSTGFNVQNNMLYLNGSSLSGKTRAEIQSMTINSVGSPDEHVGLYMTNTVKDDNTVLRIIYNNDPSKQSYLYDTPEAAAGGNRQTINVERAAAKVSVTNNATSQLTSIKLNPRSSDSENRNPYVHKMTWTLNKYNTKSYAIRTGSTTSNNWATSLNELTTLTAKDFSLYPQQSHSQDVVYIGENTTGNNTEAIVEVQLKDNNNMLIHEAYVFRPSDDSFVENAYTDIYTSAEQYIAYLRDELPPAKKEDYSLETVDNADIFKYATVTLGDNGAVTITLVNSDLTAVQQTGLTGLAEFLSSHTTGFRDGKMYYTYKIKHNDTPTYGVVRNNVYNLTLQSSSITRIGRPTP